MLHCWYCRACENWGTFPLCQTSKWISLQHLKNTPLTWCFMSYLLHNLVYVYGVPSPPWNAKNPSLNNLWIMFPNNRNHWSGCQLCEQRSLQLLCLPFDFRSSLILTISTIDAYWKVSSWKRGEISWNSLEQEPLPTYIFDRTESLCNKSTHVDQV